eukprot:330353-Amorphochlora_amoeboformis.AAC.1
MSPGITSGHQQYSKYSAFLYRALRRARDSKSRLEVETRGRDSRSRLEVKTRGRDSRSRLEVETRGRDS